MSDFDDLLDEVLADEEELRPDLARGTAKGLVSRKAAPTPSRSSSSASTDVPLPAESAAEAAQILTDLVESAPSYKPDPRPIKKPKAAPRRKPPKKNQATVPTNTKGDSPESQPARRGMARHLERSGRCPMYAPRGTVCKSCGKVHP